MTSLFSRLQKLNKEATPGPWEANEPGEGRHAVSYVWSETGLDIHVRSDGDPTIEGALIVECRNSLPAVLNLIDLLRRLSEWDALAPPVQAPFGDGPYWKREIDAALEPFIEEQP